VRGVAPVVAVCAVALAGCGGSDSKPLLVGGKPAAVHGSLTPDVHLFGEPIVARVDVVVDRDQVSPGEVELETDFEPYEAVGGTALTREDIGRFTHLRYTTVLRCLDIACIPSTFKHSDVPISQTPELPLFPENQQRAEQVKYQFPPSLVMSKSTKGEKTLGRVVWPPVRSLSRINWYDSSVVGQGFPFVATVTPLPETTYRISPTLLGLLLLALAVAIVAVPVGYVVHGRRARRVPKRDGALLSPLERALALVDWASTRPFVDERREALEALAHELDGEAVETAAMVRAHGWSPPTPASDEMTELASAVREGRVDQA
jgi:hypothetical protein